MAAGSDARRFSFWLAASLSLTMYTGAQTMTPTLERILAEVNTLSPGEKTQLREILSTEQPIDLARRQALIRDTMGKYANLPGSSEEFLSRKREDTELEDLSSRPR